MLDDHRPVPPVPVEAVASPARAALQAVVAGYARAALAPETLPRLLPRLGRVPRLVRQGRGLRPPGRAGHRHRLPRAPGGDAPTALRTRRRPRTLPLPRPRRLSP